MKTPEDAAFDEMERRQGGGFQAKRAMAADKQEPDDDLTIAYMSGVHDGKASVKAERNFCERCGKRLGKNDWDIHTCTPPSEAENQKPVALPCCGYANAEAVKWNPYNQVVQCHNCGHTYTPQRQPLTDEQKWRMYEVGPDMPQTMAGIYMRGVADAEAVNGIKENT